MRVAGIHRRTIALSDDGWAVEIIDQRLLPHRLTLARLESPEAVATAIREMQVRGAPLIGVTAAYGLCLGMRVDPSDANLARVAAMLTGARPTAVNLSWAVARLARTLAAVPARERAERAYAEALALAESDVRACRAIGEHGAELLQEIAARRAGPVRVLTHCNAGWLATVDYGTALAPVYVARERGVAVEVVVEETRPRNQGLLTAWELEQEGIVHYLVADNAGGHLMQRGEVDVCIVGTDRTTRRGDVANKIGTYLKALAAKDCGVPFWVALPSSSFDAAIDDGFAIPIEERDGDELREVSGLDARGELARVRIAPAETRTKNPAFDVTPARLVTGFITERGRAAASESALSALLGRDGRS